MEQSVTRDTIKDCDALPTQQSNTKKTIEHELQERLAAGTFKITSLKRRAKSERIAKKGKPFKFPADGSGSTVEKHGMLMMCL